MATAQSVARRGAVSYLTSAVHNDEAISSYLSSYTTEATASRLCCEDGGWCECSSQAVSCLYAKTQKFGSSLGGAGALLLSTIEWS